MNNSLTIFEGQELEILTKENVNFEFEGTVLFNGKQITDLLQYSNQNRDIDRHCDDECVFLITKDLLNTETVSGLEPSTRLISLGQRGTKFINEDGVFDLIYNSKMPKAKEFKKKVREIVKTVQQTGRFDTVEENLKLIEDGTERELNLSIYSLEKALKLNPSDLLTTLAYNNKKQELNNYIKDKKIEEVNNKVLTLEDNFNKATEQIKKTTVLREGDMSAEVIAKRFNIFSVNNIPHNRFADLLAKNLGFYRHPEGNSGYQDEYISINLESKFGKTTAIIKYSKLAFDSMKEYIDENGLRFEEPAKIFTKGEKKGQFNFAYLLFENGEHIKVNETTYKTYSKLYNE